MKPFQTLLLLVVIVLIGGLGFMYWANSVDQVVEPIEVVDSDDDAISPEPVEGENLDPGSYLIFQSIRTSHEGQQDWANDDTEEYTFYRMLVGDDTLVPFATIEHGPELGGGLTSYIFGQDILMHRYQTSRVYDAVDGRPGEGEELDAIMSLTGEILETRPENWGTFRSANDRFEVTYDFPPSRKETDGTVTIKDTQTGEIVKSLSLSLDSGEVGNPEPYSIDNSGTYLYVHQVCGCEATLAGLWEVNLETGEAQALHELVDIQAWSQTDIDPEARRLLVIQTEREPSTLGPGEDLLPPTTIQLLDLTTGEVKDLYTSDSEAFDHPYLDPSGEEQYLLRPWEEGNRVVLFPFEMNDAPEELVDGWVQDWVGDWLVLGDGNSTSVFNMETRETTTIDLPEGAERFEYVGSVVIE
ncbi:hypothetical protein HZA87_02935 [Candidatus Uhrbacteria bacterium]|nr:hypothetical protein [Candidatus Uhrbacteria bacterium]